VNYVLAGRTIGQVLGRSQGAAVPWYLAAGVTPTAAYAPKGATSLPDSYINLANPGTYDAAPGTAPTFATATGWTFNGSTQWLTSGIVPVSNQSWTMIIRFANAVTTGGILAGVQHELGTTFFGIQPIRSGNTVGYFSGLALSVGPALATGTLAVSGSRAYRNGSQESGAIPAGTGSFSTAIYIGRMSGNESYPYYIACSISSLWIANSTLDAAQVAAQSAAMP
jgi:hypothetical protein